MECLHTIICKAVVIEAPLGHSAKSPGLCPPIYSLKQKSFTMKTLRTGNWDHKLQANMDEPNIL